MSAAKFFDDQYYNNAYYAKVGGVPCMEMNALEVEFLFKTNFTLFVTTETYVQYYNELINHAKNSRCSCRGIILPPLRIPSHNFEEGGYFKRSSDSLIAIPQKSNTEKQAGNYAYETTSTITSTTPVIITKIPANTKSTITTRDFRQSKVAKRKGYT